jgi:hypothetical protein
MTKCRYVIAAGFLLFATTSNAAFAQTSSTTSGPSTSASATSSISQSNTQSATCTAVLQILVHAGNFNSGNVVSAALAGSSKFKHKCNCIFFNKLKPYSNRKLYSWYIQFHLM